ncbi:hypothetical protein LTR37_013326 [Vermiconidia calcicola]|uniref:Uncharacterized protein n=1 Tax=Vermiconidia calcicola TaxID=1690605 RepID=A0ACC3MWM1_9PEZI|nr:hypothetical protein LTR37_013326 [Vermiconidia calcicola]
MLRLGKAAEEVDPEIAANDKEIAAKLDDEQWAGVLRDQMNQLKGQLGSLTVTRGKTGNALKQATELLEMLSSGAAQEQEQLEQQSAMEEGDEESSPLASVHALAFGLSEKGLTDWCIGLVKAFGLGPKKGRPETGSKRKAGPDSPEGDDDGAEEEEGDEDDDGDAAQEEVQRPKAHPKKRTKKNTGQS